MAQCNLDISFKCKFDTDKQKEQFQIYCQINSDSIKNYKNYLKWMSKRLWAITIWY